MALTPPGRLPAESAERLVATPPSAECCAGIEAPARRPIASKQSIGNVRSERNSSRQLRVARRPQAGVGAAADRNPHSQPVDAGRTSSHKAAFLPSSVWAGRPQYCQSAPDFILLKLSRPAPGLRGEAVITMGSSDQRRHIQSVDLVSGIVVRVCLRMHLLILHCLIGFLVVSLLLEHLGRDVALPLGAVRVERGCALALHGREQLQTGKATILRAGESGATAWRSSPDMGTHGGRGRGAGSCGGWPRPSRG